MDGSKKIIHHDLINAVNKIANIFDGTQKRRKNKLGIRTSKHNSALK